MPQTSAFKTISLPHYLAHIFTSNKSAIRITRRFPYQAHVIAITQRASSKHVVLDKTNGFPIEYMFC